MTLGERIIFYSSLSTSIVSLLVGISVYVKNRRAIINKTWCLLTLSTAIWNLGYCGTIIAPSKFIALFWSRYFLYGGALFVPPFFSTLFYHS